jgi:hypothetical protein
MTQEEADRLSEQFRPSWEDDPPTVPRDQPIPTAPSEPRTKVPASGPAVTMAPVVSVTKAPAVPIATGKPSSASSAQAAAPLTVAPSQKPTLLGTAPAAPSGSDPAGARSLEGGDLEWEAPTNPLPEASTDAELQIDVEELPPDSKPSGIGQKYKPKDEGAPPVMLGEEVQAAESGARARLEAEHRARRAPTIMGINALELPTAAAPPERELNFVVPRRRSFGVMVGIGLLALVGGVGGVLFLARGGATSTPPPASSAITTAMTTTIAPDTAAPPPAVPGPEAAPAPVVPAASAAASTAVEPPAPSGDAREVSAEAASTPVKAPVPAKPPAPVVKPAAKPVAAKATPQKLAGPKPTSAAVKPSSPAKLPAGKSMIVRENPF